MHKDQEIQAIGRLFFELTRVSVADGGLDKLQARLFDLLRDLPGIQIIPKSAILLFNPRNRLIQVAQFGLAPAWLHNVQYDDGVDAVSVSRGQAYVCTPRVHLPPLSLLDVDGDAPCFVLPLREESRQLGRMLLFIEPNWVPDPMAIQFMSDLAGTMSALVARCLIDETLRLRELELEDARTDAIRRLGAASEYRDNETGMHVMRMTHYANAIAGAMDLPAEMRELLSICAPMHDVGKIGIPDAILLKPGRLTIDEFEVMKTHTEIGKRLLTGDDSLIAAASDIANYHHERWDGTGYPNGLAGEAIPVLARICAIADVFDALTSVRPYKHPWPLEEAIEWVRSQAGIHFDPVVVAAFERALPQILRIRELYRDDIIDPKQILNLPPAAHRDLAWIPWDEELRIGIDVIDEHHRYLFDLANDLFDAVANRRGSRDVLRVLKALDQYAQVHFCAEERMMESHGYSALGRQQEQHRHFEEKLREFNGEFHDNPLTAQFDVLRYLSGWLIQHIRREDAMLKVLVDGS